MPLKLVSKKLRLLSTSTSSVTSSAVSHFLSWFFLGENIQTETHVRGCTEIVQCMPHEFQEWAPLVKSWRSCIALGINTCVVSFTQVLGVPAHTP
ncbi:hypothetical protein OG21DRAFT_1505914 [Imleria badia]|nr:hypothetical protein OG21DRAFT_1505914 [Imleria badia]